MKPFTEEELNQIRLYGFSKPLDFARLLHMAKLALETKQAMEELMVSVYLTASKERSETLLQESRKVIESWDEGYEDE